MQVGDEVVEVRVFMMVMDHPICEVLLTVREPLSVGLEEPMLDLGSLKLTVHLVKVDKVFLEDLLQRISICVAIVRGMEETSEEGNGRFGDVTVGRFVVRVLHGNLNRSPTLFLGLLGVD